MQYTVSGRMQFKDGCYLFTFVCSTVKPSCVLTSLFSSLCLSFHDVKVRSSSNFSLWKTIRKAIETSVDTVHTAYFSKRFWRVGYLLGGIGWVTARLRKILRGFLERRWSKISKRQLSEPPTAWFWEGWIWNKVEHTTSLDWCGPLIHHTEPNETLFHLLIISCHVKCTPTHSLDIINCWHHNIWSYAACFESILYLFVDGQCHVGHNRIFVLQSLLKSQ